MAAVTSCENSLYPKGMAFALFWSEKGYWLQLPILFWNRAKYRKYSCRGKFTKSNKEMLTEKIFTRLESSPGTHAITFSNGQSLNLLSYFLDDVISCILVYIISGGSRAGARGARPPPLCLDRTEARGAEKNFFETEPPLVSGSGRPPTAHRLLTAFVSNVLFMLFKTTSVARKLWKLSVVSLSLLKYLA